MVKQLQKRVYTATVTSTGGRDGRSQSADGAIDFKMGKPVEMGGKGDGVNPEQLFAAGYSACFLGALKFVAGQDKIAVADDASITAAVTFGPIDHGFGLAVELTATLPGMDKAAAEVLVEKAHQVCPYSNATRGNVEVTLTVA